MHTNSQVKSRVHIQIERELVWKTLSGLNDPGVRNLREAREADSIDSSGTVDIRIELAGSIMVICRLSPVFILFPATVNLN